MTAVVKAIGSLELNFDGFYFSIESDNYELLTFCQTLAKDVLDVNSEIQSSNPNATGAAVYTCEFNNAIGAKLGLTYRDEEGSVHLNGDVKSLLPKSDCCKRAFMQGLLLAAGSVVIPVVDSDVGENTSERLSASWNVIKWTPDLYVRFLTGWEPGWLYLTRMEM